MKYILYFLLILVSWSFFIPAVFASVNIDCPDRYVTLVNPVRARSLWFDRSLKPFRDQYEIIKENNFPATWLLQYDTFADRELQEEIKKITSDQEVGVFLEVSKNLGDKARVVYPYDAPWFSPRAVFLSGYSQSQRRLLIDALFYQFKEQFGYYPKSVGAWWVDSYSLNYMKEKYGIRAVLIVADQLTTDNYGVWGQWWGVPYYSAKANILTPASSLNDKQEVVVTQWAQRDPLLAKGEGADFSNYSLQANDYIRQGKDTSYFVNLAEEYLSCRNKVGQITIGLETGIESVGYIAEYENQLTALKKIPGLQAVTMSRFAEKFKQVYPNFPAKAGLGSGETEWRMTVTERQNDSLKDSIVYKPEIAFPDYFLADKSGFLDRKLTGSAVLGKSGKLDSLERLGWLGVLGVLGLAAWRRKKIRVWAAGALFSLAAFGLILKSHLEYGWLVYYGAKVPWLPLAQIGLVLFSLILVWVLSRCLSRWRKLKFLNLWLLPLSFGVDPLIQSLRFTFVSGKYYFGFIIDAFRFIGLSYVHPFQLGIVNQDFPAYQAAALLRLNFNKIWDNLWLSLIIYPLVHILLALGLGLIIWRLSPKWRKVIIGLLAVLFIWQLMVIWNADPRVLTHPQTGEDIREVVEIRDGR